MTAVAAGGHPFEGLGVLEWALVGLSALVAVWVIVRAVQLTLRPGEEDPRHLKRMILDDDATPPAAPPKPGTTPNPPPANR